MSPRLGDIVLFTQPEDEPTKNGARQFAAIVTAVHSENCVNLTVFADNGQTERWLSVERKGLNEPQYGFWEPKE